LQNNQNISQTQSQQTNGQISSVTNQDLQNLASALQTGDLSGAKQAYAQLTQDLQSSGQTQGHHHHHHHHKASGTSQSNTANQAIGAAGSVGNTSSTNGQTSLLA
jgi:pantothenate kinase